VVVVTAGLAGMLHFFNATYDDAFIPFRYAANLVAGHGLVFNPGERVEGYSNFLWTVALAVPTWLGVGRSELGMLLFAKLCGVVFNTATLLLLLGFAPGKDARVGRVSVPIAAVYVATCAPFLMWGVGGLETPLVTLLLVGAILLYDREAALPRSHSGSAMMLLGAALTRPEPVVLAAVFTLLRLLPNDRTPRRSWREVLGYFLTFAVPYGVFLCWRWMYYGQLLPNTYYAKVYTDHRASVRGLDYVVHAFSDLNWTALLLLSVACIVLGRRWSRRVTVLIALLAVHLAGVVYEGGDWMPAYRLLVPAVPIVGLVVREGWIATHHFQVGVPELPDLPAWFVPARWVERSRTAARWLARTHWYPRVVALARPAARALLLLAVAVGGWGSFRAVRVRGLESGFSRIHLDNFGHFEVARWMRAERKDAGLLAIGEAGVIPYYTQLPIVDMFGLMDPHIAHLHGVRHRKFDVDYVLDRHPRYVFLVFSVRPDTHRLPAHRHGAILLHNQRFLEEYEVCKDFGSSALYCRRTNEDATDLGGADP